MKTLENFEDFGLDLAENQLKGRIFGGHNSTTGPASCDCDCELSTVDPDCPDGDYVQDPATGDCVAGIASSSVTYQLAP